MATKYDLSVVLKAVDKATAPVRALTVQIHRLTAPLKNVKLFDQFKELGKAVNLEGLQKGFSGVGTALGGVSNAAFGFMARLTAIAALGAVAFVGFIRSAEAAGSRLDDNSKRAGVTADWYAQTEFAAKKAGIENEEFAAGVDMLVKNLGAMQAGKGGKFLAFLNDISPTFAKQVKGAKTTGEAFNLLTKSLAAVEDPARRAILSQKAFGNSKFGTWLGDGTAALEKQRATYLRLAGSQEEFASRSGAMGDAFDDVEVAAMGLRSAVAGALFPALTKLVNLVTEFVVKNRDGLKRWAESAGAAIQRWVDSGGFERLVDNLTAIASAVGRVVEWLGPMGTVFAAVGAMALPLIASLGSLGVAVVSLAVEAIPLLVAAAPAIASATAAMGAGLITVLPFVAAAAGLALAGKAIYDNWDELKYLFENIGETLAITWRDGLKPMLDGVKFLRFAIPGGPAAWEAGMALGDSLAGPQPGLSGSVDAYRHATAPALTPPAESRVTVDFANLPRGTRVSTDPTGTQPVDLNMGWSNWEPQ